MIDRAAPRVVPPELTADPRVAGRVTRLAGVSLVALGVISLLAAAGTDASWMVLLALVAGWLTMPTVLVLSLRRPERRRWLVVPSTLVTLGLLAIALAWLPDDPAAGAGWLLLLAGVLVGDGLGTWFWFRLLPVPVALQDPLGRGRWGLIALHAGLVVAGALLVIGALVADRVTG